MHAVSVPTHVMQVLMASQEVESMLESLIAKVKRSWAFAVAAASLPLSYILLSPCFGANCGGCPSGGTCLLAAPFLIIMIGIAKIFKKKPSKVVT